ncbi:unnamed protein product [Triticum turgidum subsp. durum]|uniref:Uncharacterized protein n=2 Tax=Triticinae TaxID=1648030 RepID=A0A9R0XU08_TRITD|nr:unnamed protein product [Triticum turgidum subsp. durum]
MAANRGMVAGSHNRNEFVMIRNDGDAPAPVRRSKARLVRPARYVATLLAFRPLATSLSPAMSAPSRSAALATSTSARMGSNAVPSARLDTRGSKVAPGFREMRRKKMSMTWTMSSTISKGMAKVQSGKEKTLICLHPLAMNLIIVFLGSQVGNRMSGEIPDASPDRHSIRSPTSSYVDPSVPVL